MLRSKSKSIIVHQEGRNRRQSELSSGGVTVIDALSNSTTRMERHSQSNRQKDVSVDDTKKREKSKECNSRRVGVVISAVAMLQKGEKTMLLKSCLDM